MTPEQLKAEAEKAAINAVPVYPVHQDQIEGMHWRNFIQQQRFSYQQGYVDSYEAAQSRIEQLEAAIRIEQTGLAKALESIVNTAKGYEWIARGERGPYPYDDNRYTEETGIMIEQILGIAGPALNKAGLDATICLNNPPTEGLFNQTSK